MFQGVRLQSTVQPVISSHGGLGLGLVSHFIGVSGFKVTGLDCTTYIIQPRQERDVLLKICTIKRFFLSSKTTEDIKFVRVNCVNVDNYSYFK